METPQITIGLYDDLITQTYMIGTGEASLDDVLGVFHDAFPFMMTAFHGYDIRDRFNLLFAFRGVSESNLNAYLEHYADVNPYRKYIADTASIMRIGIGQDVMTDDELSKTEFYNDYLKPNGDVGQTFGLPLFMEKTRFLHWSNNYNARYARDAAVAQNVVACLAPHIRRSMEMLRQLEGCLIENAGLKHALHRFSTPPLICTSALEVSFINDAGEDLLRAGRVMDVKKGKLHFLSFLDHKNLKQKIRQMSNPETSGIADQLHLFARLLLPLHKPMLAFVAPLPSDAPQRTLLGTPIERQVLVLLIDPNHMNIPKEELVQAALHITPAEARLACAIAAGDSLRHYAEVNALSYNTARNQLQSIFHKTGCQKQSEMIQIITNIFSRLNLQRDD